MRVRAVSGFAFVMLLISAVSSAGFGVWTTNGPPGSGGSTVVIADPLHPGTLYASDSLGIANLQPYASRDFGATWMGLNIAGENPTPLATAPPATVYLAYYLCGEATCSGFVKVSGDGGATWRDLHDSISSWPSFQMVVDPVPTNLFIGENNLYPIPPHSGSLSRSTDSGMTWTRVDSGLALYGVVISAMVGTRVSGTLYVATIPGGDPNATSGLFKTVDAGSTWTQLTSAPSLITALAADPTNAEIVYAGTAGGVFKSLDGGATFAATNTGLTSSPITSFAINPVQPANVFVGTAGSGVFRSADGGSTWQPMNAGLTYLYVSTLAIDGDGSSLHAGTGVVFDYQFPVSSCSADAHTLCLNNGRFSVSADFQPTPEGPSSPATAVPLTSDTGYFWFFDAANIELVTKVLNGCATNGHYWFFAGGLTNVGVQIQVKDTFSGAEQDYSNPVGTAFAPIQDTAAFATCP